MILVAALLAASAAYAGNDHYDPPKPQPTPTTKVDIDVGVISSSKSEANAAAIAASQSKSDSHSNSYSKSEGGDAYAKGGTAVSVSQGGKGGHATSNAQGGKGGNSDASATQSQNAEGGAANNEGNSLSVNNEDRLQAPSISAPALYPSGNCAYGWTAGLSIPGGGISGGKAKPDADCNRRQAARVVGAWNPALALKVMCEDPYVKAVAKEGDCVYTPPAPPVVVEKETAKVDPQSSSNTADKEYVDRAIKKALSK